MKTRPGRIDEAQFAGVEARPNSDRRIFALFVLLLVSLLGVVSCSDGASGGNDAGVPDGGDSGTDTDPYAVPEPVIEEPPPLADCEIDWVRTYEFPDAGVDSSSIRGMTQLQNGNYLAVGGAWVTDVGEQGMLIEITPEGDLVDYVFRGEHIGSYHHVFENDDGLLVFGQSLQPDDYSCTAALVSADLDETIWESNIGIEGPDDCDGVGKNEDEEYYYSGSNLYIGELQPDFEYSTAVYADIGNTYDLTILENGNLAVIANDCTEGFPFFCTPKLVLSSGTQVFQVITYEHAHSAAFSEMIGSGDGHVLLSGGQESYNGRIYLLYINEDGVPEWSRFVGNENSPGPNGLVRDDQGYLFGGYSVDDDAYLGRLDQDGHLLWHFLYDEPENIAVLGVFKGENDGGILSFGTHQARPWLMKIRPNEVCY